MDYSRLFRRSESPQEHDTLHTTDKSKPDDDEPLLKTNKSRLSRIQNKARSTSDFVHTKIRC